MTGICPSFMVEKKNMKALKGHPSFFFNRSWFLGASEFVFPKNRSLFFENFRKFS